MLKFSAFNQHTTPELQGTLDRLAFRCDPRPADRRKYYSARIRVDEAEFGKISDLKLVAGMPVEGFISDRREECPLLPHEAVSRSA